MAINGLIEDSNLKYGIVNLQLGFSPENLIWGAAEPLLQVHLQHCRVSPQASDNSPTLILMSPVQSISLIFMVVILRLQRSFKLYSGRKFVS